MCLCTALELYPLQCNTNTLVTILLFYRIDSNFLIKISDFGLSEDVYGKNYFKQSSSGEVVKLPVKWMAPESLSDGHFSEKSDVVSILSYFANFSTIHSATSRILQWSYGVTVWEIFSGGKAPYPGVDPLTLMQLLESGRRMNKPANAAFSDELLASLFA